jgi:glycosyltransferase involved in cell wall biosynthesis
MSYKISVCIPSYNRSIFLEPLLDSIRKQTVQPYEIVVCEDFSDERDEIEKILIEFQQRYPDINLKYFLNTVNLGFDKNLKELISKSSGDYCFYMGNDDLMNENAIKRVKEALDEYGEIGVFSRSYSWFLGAKGNITGVAKHLPESKLFKSGIDAISFFYRRSAVLSGMVYNRERALEIETDKYDGTLYYQLYLTGKILEKSDGFYISEVQTYSREGIKPDFGNSEGEKNFTPGMYTHTSRLHMIKSILNIAKDLNENTLGVYKKIEKDLAYYLFPYIMDQLRLPLKLFIKFYLDIMKTGLGGYFPAHIHLFLGYILKKKMYLKAVDTIKSLFGRTPYIK